MKHLTNIILAFVLLVFFSSVYAQKISEADSITREAAKQFSNKNYKSSLNLAQEALKLDKNNIRAWILAARSHYYLYNPYETISTAAEGLKLSADSDTLNNVTGAAYLDMFQYDKAMTYFERANKINKNYSHPYYNIETIYFNKRNFQKLIAAYTTHLKALPQENQILLKRAEVYEFLHDYENAIKDYKTYLTLLPEDKSVFNKLASCYFYMGNYAEAVNNYKLSGSSQTDSKIYNWIEITETLQKGNFIFPCIWGDCEYGTGVYVDKSGTIYTGKWINNLFNYGVAVYKNKSLYQGYFDSDYKKNGYGCEKTSNGKLNSGYFKDDVFVGSQSIKYDLSKYRMKEVFRDDFDNQDKKWESRDSDSALKISYDNSKLILSNTKTGKCLLYHSYKSDYFQGTEDNFMVECNFKVTETNYHCIFYLYFASSNIFLKETYSFPEAYNYFSISGSYTPTNTKEKNREIHNEPYYCYDYPLTKGSSYKMSVVVQGDIVRTFINDTYVGFAAFKSLGNYLGMMLTDKISVEIDNITVYTYSLNN